mgnify:CR=1 FL=1
MKLIILTKATFFVEEDIILTTLFEEGMDNMHLYKPDSEPVYSERLLSLLPEEFYKHITVHDHYYLREEYGLKGIHLNTPDAEIPYGYRGNISRTCRSLIELQSAKKNSNYVFLKTIFDSQSTPDDKHSFTIDQLKQASRQGLIDKHVYAMGGITLDNIKLVADLGFGGAVICGDLWNRFNIHQGQDYKEVISHFKKLQKAID